MAKNPKSIKATPAAEEAVPTPLPVPIPQLPSMSIRETFAMAAIQGLGSESSIRFTPQIIADRAFRIADAMVWQSNNPLATVPLKQRGNT